ncbi:terpenoid cyclases/Protein prenyltransferases superfamily protein [Actinidia rufa]|uniref:Terpenoid cyclases/Protein prenyltransferases superfamily protein n=1 Tax=Actinidia rufa TaxID=165716 RepID=A0A7J0G6X8_9ERIC|nr:terpenoid cyclases/Protein prenyltransferases superfamily protein [Actinidia rufa]
MEQEQLHQLKQKVVKMLVASADKPSQMLNLIDGLQRLGVSYHFTTEIEAALKHIYETCDHSHFDDLYTVALFFRLLRQQGFPVSCEMFNKFKNNQGKFQECLIGDAVGILSLYEATHLRVRGEEILDEALTFTTHHLESMVPNLSNPIAEHVVNALNQSIHKGLTRLDARCYISFHEQDDSHNKDLLNFAKLDFNLLQKLHQREPSEITRWWKDLDFAKKLPFARDRLVECYFWVLGVYFEPQYWLARRILTKVIAMFSIIDDIYDAYGTLEELALFTDAIERWEISSLDQLPEYMKLCYRSLLDVYSTIDEEMAKQGGSYRVDYAKSEMKNLVRGYIEEAKWFHQGYVPSMEEYMQVGLLTCGYKMLATVSYVGMGELATKEAFDWVSSFPLIVEAASVINRLTDDIVDHRFEQQGGHMASAIECYMKQHGATEEEAIIELYEQVTNAWKDMNAECLYSTNVPMPLLVRVLNLARVINVLYKDEDGYTHSGTRTKNFVTLVLIDSVPIN